MEGGGGEGVPAPSIRLSPVLWTYYEHLFELWVWFKNPKRIIIIASRHLICSLIAISQTISFGASKQKPVYIIETVKQLGRYLIRYAYNRVYDLDESICKQSWGSVQWNQLELVIL